ncbi:MAG: hypothetical protein O6945_05030 [Gammaproteobacteria bacterium]|nr:hypothetical protein [Gammaproteobacteria bacterium]
MNQVAETKTDLIPIESIAHPLALFCEGGLDDLLEQIRLAAWLDNPDATTQKGRKEIVSAAYKATLSKGVIVAAGKGLIGEWKKQAGMVSTESKRAQEFLDQLSTEIRAPVTEYEASIKLKKAMEDAHDAAIVENDYRDMRAKLAEQEAQLKAANAKLVKQQRADTKQREADQEERNRLARAGATVEEAAPKVKGDAKPVPQPAEPAKPADDAWGSQVAPEQALSGDIRIGDSSVPPIIGLTATQVNYDLEHQRTVNIGAFEALRKTGLSRKAAKHIVVAVAKEEIPGMRMVY